LALWMSSGRISAKKLGKSQPTADFFHALTTNLTEHDSHGPDDQLKTIDYHHLGMSRGDVLDEHGIDHSLTN
jgi:hypothetical protein